MNRFVKHLLAASVATFLVIGESPAAPKPGNSGNNGGSNNGGGANSGGGFNNSSSNNGNNNSGNNNGGFNKGGGNQGGNSNGGFNNGGNNNGGNNNGGNNNIQKPVFNNNTNNNVQKPVFNNNNVQNPAPNTDNNVQKPVFNNTNNNVKKPSLDTTPTVKKPSLDTTTKKPSLDATNNVKKPSLDTTPTVKKPSLDTTPTVKKPSLDTTNNVKKPSLDTTTKKPSLDTAPTVKKPSLDTTPTVKKPSLDTTTKKPSLDSTSNVKKPSLDSTNNVKKPSLDTTNTVKKPSLDTTTSGKKPTLDAANGTKGGAKATGNANSSKVNTKLTGKNIATSTPKVPEALKAKVDQDPKLKDAVAKAQQKAKDEQKQNHKPASIPTGKGKATTSAPTKITSKSGNAKNDAKALQAATSTDPKAKAAAAKLGDPKKKVTSNDLNAIKNSAGKSTDPKVAGPAHRQTASTFAGLSLSDNAVGGLVTAGKDNKHFSPAEQTLINQVKAGTPPLTPDQAAQYALLQDRPGISKQEQLGLIQSNLDVQQQIHQTNATNQLLQTLGNGLGGSLLNAGVLNGGFFPGGGGDGGFIPGGPGGFPPGMPVAWFPADPSSAGGADGIPDGPGVEVAFLPGANSGFDDGEVQDSPDQADSLASSGDVAQAAAILQQTRYLRVGNQTDKPITVFVQYQTLNDKDQWVWSGEGDDALQFQLQPGEVTDLDDNGWRVNAVSAHVWAKADGEEWNTFKDQELWLVPEKDEDGNHAYQDQDVQVFDFMVH